MDSDDLGAGCLAVFAVLLGIAYVFGFLLGVGAVFAGTFFLGVVANLAIRYVANRFNWLDINEDWIWLVIGSLTAVPVVIGELVVLIPPLWAFVSGDAGYLKAWLAVPFFFLWLAGYIWAWWSPRFERGMADALMSSTFITAWARVQMWWEYKKLGWRLMWS